MGAKRVSKQGVTVSTGNAIEVTNTTGSVLFSVDSTGSLNTLPNLTAKGSILTASATSTPTTLAVGTNEQRLVADSATTSGLKYVADTTNYAVGAKGDLLVGTAADTVINLAVGTNGHVLTADSATTSGVKWAAAAGGKVLQVVQGTTTTQTSNSTDVLADTTLTATITPSAATSKILVLAHHNGVSKSDGNANNAVQIQLLRGATTIATVFAGYTGTTLRLDIGTNAITYLDSPNTTSATTYKTQFKNGGVNAASVTVQQDSAFSSITLIEIGA